MAKIQKWMCTKYDQDLFIRITLIISMFSNSVQSLCRILAVYRTIVLRLLYTVIVECHACRQHQNNTIIVQCSSPDLKHEHPLQCENTHQVIVKQKPIINYVQNRCWLHNYLSVDAFSHSFDKINFVEANEMDFSIHFSLN